MKFITLLNCFFRADSGQRHHTEGRLHEGTDFTDTQHLQWRAHLCVHYKITRFHTFGIHTPVGYSNILTYLHKNFFVRLVTQDMRRSMLCRVGTTVSDGLPGAKYQKHSIYVPSKSHSRIWGGVLGPVQRMSHKRSRPGVKKKICQICSRQGRLWLGILGAA
jgi:hypothetical protein